MTDRPMLVTVEAARLRKLCAIPKMPERTQFIQNESTIKPELDMFICVFQSHRTALRCSSRAFPLAASHPGQNRSGASRDVDLVSLLSLTLSSSFSFLAS